MSDLTETYSPSHQIVVYKNDHGNNGYVEHREIVNIEGKDYLSEGKPLTKKALRDMLDIVIDSKNTVFATVKELIPDNILYYDPRPGRLVLVWWQKPSERQLSGMYKRAVKYKCPSLIYVLKDDSISIYAMKGIKKPTLKTALYHLPVPNIHDDGMVCMGNVKKPKHTVEISELVKLWENSFWLSKFDEGLISESEFKKLKQAIRMKVPIKQLKPFRKTLKHILDEKN